MFNLAEVEDYVRVEPKLFGLETKDAVRQQLKNTYSGFLNKELGFIISVVEVMKVEEGVVIPGGGAVYYNSRFKLLIWKPEIQELIPGIVKDVANFGAFVSLGVAEGLIHITQVTDDYVTYSKTGTLTSKNGKKSLKKGDQCLARIVAISYKAEQPKVGLTMRQPGLGKLEWIKDEKRKGKKEAVEEKVKIKNTKGKKK